MQFNLSHTLDYKMKIFIVVPWQINKSSHKGEEKKNIFVDNFD